MDVPKRPLHFLSIWAVILKVAMNNSTKNVIKILKPLITAQGVLNCCRINDKVTSEEPHRISFF